MDAPGGKKIILFHFSSPVRPPSVSPLNAASSPLYDSLSRIPHHAFLHPEHRLALDHFLSSVFIAVVTNKEQLTDFLRTNRES